MTEEKLKEIREDCIEFIRYNAEGTSKHCTGEDLICSLYNLLHKTVTGEEYNYFFHWANKAGYEVDENLWEDKNNG